MLRRNDKEPSMTLARRLALCIFAALCMSVLSFGQASAGVEFHDDLNVVTTGQVAAAAETIPSCNQKISKLKLRNWLWESVGPGTDDVRIMSTEDTEEEEEPSPPKVSAPSMSPSVPSAVNDIKCKPSGQLYPSKVDSFTDQGAGPAVALVVGQNGTVHGKNYPAGRKGAAHTSLKQAFNDKGVVRDVPAQSLAGPVIVVAVDDQGRPVLKDDKLVASKPGMVKVDPEGNLILASDRRAAFFVEIKDDGSMCIPDLGDQVKMPILGIYGQELKPTFAAKNVVLDPGCEAMHPAVRLFTNQLGAGAVITYSNLSGRAFAGTPETSAFQTEEKTTYQFGFGYDKKPILRDIRAVLEGDTEGYKAVLRQNTPVEDFVFNAFTFTGGLSYGRNWVETNDELTTSNSDKPYFLVQANWSVDLQRVIQYVAYGAQPADTGYYYRASTPELPE